MKDWFILMLQDSISPMMEWLLMFHDFTLLINLVITIVIVSVLINIFMNKFINFSIENQNIEIIWTLVPIFMLLILGVPSMKILYMLDEIYTPLLTIKVMGHQWYWSYEYSDFYNSGFDSYMVKDYDVNSFRLLDVSDSLVLPISLQLRFLVSSEDVIHSFTVPSMGVKLDAVPGRINQMGVMILMPGVHYGQCSEICGAAHSFMPIMVESTLLKYFIKFML